MKDTGMHETLGDNVIPSRYVLRLEPDFRRFTYAGEETIYADVRKETDRIVINAGELKILKAEVKDKGAVQEAIVKSDKERERITLSLKRKVSGSVEIRIAFEGINNDKLYGFYRSRYMVGGAQKHMLTTQFEPANARNAFPCFDEPSFKARFDLSVVADEKLLCISNMPAGKEERLADGRKLVTFESTPRMSSYLLYLGIGKLVRTCARYRNVEIGVVTTPGKEKYAGLAAGYAARFLEYFERYFGIMYPLPKLDLIAVPDFSAGAMENWGAITFRETALLGDEKSSVASKQRIAEVIAHELVHQWFGDLVTMKWWNDLWLNESFANFMSYKAMDSVMPEWEMMTQYTAGVVGAAFAADQLASTHPISVGVANPAEVDQIFDDISYNKGGAVLSMIEEYVGSETFRKGLGLYLRKNSYSNAEKSDLWNAIGEAAGSAGRKLEVQKVAECWIDNKGYPAVSVSEKKGVRILTQSRFVLKDGVRDGTRWLIPISMVHPPGTKEERFLMKGESVHLRPQQRGQVKLNHRQKGFYRTVYTEDMLENLGEMIKNAEMGGIDSWGVENDLYALTKKRVYTLDKYLGFVDKYCFAAKYPLNIGVLSHLRGLFSLFYGKGDAISEEVRRLLGAYSIELIKEVGWKKTADENSTTTLIRSAAVLGSGMSGEKMTLNKVRKLFEESAQRPIDANLSSAIYGLVAWSEGSGAYGALRERYMKESLPEEKIKLLASLGMFSSAQTLVRSLDFSLTKGVRYQDSFYIPAYVSSNPFGREVIWEWTRRNWDTLRERFKSGTHMLGRYLDSVAAASDPKTAAEVRRFFSEKRNMRPDLKSSLAETLEIMEINSRFVSYNRKIGIAGEE